MSFVGSVLEVPAEMDRVLLTQALDKVGAHHKYQYFLVVCSGLIYWTSNSFTIGLAYEMVPPLMRCKDGSDCSYDRACSEGGYTFRSESLHNMTYEWRLVCERQYMGSVIGVANFAGIALGSILASWTTNAFGRKKTALVGMIMQTSGLFAAYFTPSPEVMYVVSCWLGTSVGLSTVGSFLLQMEMTDSEHRSWFVGILYACWSLSTIMQPGLFYSLPRWQDVVLPTAFLSLLAFPLLLVQLESVRWLAVNKRDVPATEAAFQAIARYNGRLGVTIKLHFPPAAPPAVASFFDLFKSWKLIYRMFVLSVLQIMMNLGYYGVYFAIPSYFGNLFVNGVVLGVGEMIPFLVSGKVIGKIERKVSNFVSLVGSGIVLVAAWLSQDIQCQNGSCSLRNWVQTTFLFLGIFLVSSYCVAIAVICTEVFNSQTRGPAAGYLNAMARVGGAISTLLLLMQAQWGVPPLLVIGGTALFSAMFIFTLPETLGRDMEAIN